MLRARAVPIYGEEEKTIAVEAMMRAVLSLFEKVVKLSRTLPDDSYIMAMNVDEPGWLADLIASTLPLDVPRRQEILETIDPEERLRRLSIMLTQELDVLELESRIHTQVQKEVDRSQREFFLREQMKAIQRELGQEDPLQRELLELREKIAAAGMPEKVQLKATEELERHGGHVAGRAGVQRHPHLPGLAARPALDPADRRHPRPDRGRAHRSTATTTGCRRSRSASSSLWPCGSWPARGSRRRSCASSGRRASARPRWAARSPRRWAAASCASRSAASTTRPRSAATGAPISARCRAG